MKNKKGFTLIELLAVIVILAIIALIATPIILNMINDARKSAAVDSAYGYIKAIEYNNSMSQLDKEKYTEYTSGEYSVSDINLTNLKGTKPTSGKVVIENKVIKSATLCIGGYNVVYNGTKAEVTDAKCSSDSEKEEVIIKPTDSSCFKVSGTSIIGFSDEYSEEKCSTDLVIPTIINNTVITEIGANAFTDKNITSLNFEDDSQIVTIHEYAFKNTPLTSLVLPKRINNLGSEVFSNTKLTSLDLSNYMGNFGTAFSNISTLKTLKLPKSALIPSGSFLNTGVESLTITGDTNLSSILNVFGTKIEDIKIKNVVFEEGVQTIQPDLFYNISSIESVSFPSTLSSIENNAFNGTSIKEINLPSNISSIGINAFSNISLEKDIEIPSTINFNQSVFSNSSLKKVTINSGTQSISPSMFENSTIEEINIPSSINNIGSNAFGNATIGNLKLPKTLIFMSSAFTGATINNICYEGTETEFQNQTQYQNTELRNYPVSYNCK